MAVNAAAANFFQSAAVTCRVGAWVTHVQLLRHAVLNGSPAVMRNSMVDRDSSREGARFPESI
jgi:hypothetical protein